MCENIVCNPEETMVHTFFVGQKVKYCNESKRSFEGSEDTRYTQEHFIAEVQSVPRTNRDPFSLDYAGGMEGQDAVGHHQLIRFEGDKADYWVSGAHLEPV